jgi:hypothetical protein
VYATCPAHLVSYVIALMLIHTTHNADTSDVRLRITTISLRYFNKLKLINLNKEIKNLPEDDLIGDRNMRNVLNALVIFNTTFED